MTQAVMEMDNDTFFLHQLLILEHGWNSSKKGPCSLPSFLMVEYQLLVAGGFVKVWGPLGGVDLTRDVDLLEPDSWIDPFFTHL